MRKIIPKYTDPEKGNFQLDLVDNVNGNTNILFQNIGAKMQKFNSKVRSFGLYKSDIIRVSIWADSLWNSYKTTFQTMLQTNYPNKTFEFLHAQMGATGPDYHAALIEDVINFNPDLIIIGEDEGFSFMSEIKEVLIKRIRQRSSSDIVIVPWSITKLDMDKLILVDKTQWLASSSYKLRQFDFAIASKYNCQVIDWFYLAIPDLVNGVVTPTELHQVSDDVHLSTLFYTNYATPVFQMHFQSLHNFEYLNNYFAEIFYTQRLVDAIEFPDFTDIVKSGIWDVNTVSLDKSVRVIRSSQAGAYIEQTIEGIGFELAYFSGNIGQFKIEIGLNGGTLANPNTLIKDYATTSLGNTSLVSRPYKVIVNSNILTNDETSRQFTITIGTIVRDGGGIITSAPYALYDVTKSVSVGNGNYNTDSTFSYDGGSITIPSMYAGMPNLREATIGTIPTDTGNVFTFYIKKNWYNTIDVTATNLTTVKRIFGLPRGKHTVRITRNSGTINLDSIMELK